LGKIQTRGNLGELKLAFHVGKAVGFMRVDPVDNLGTKRLQQLQDADIVAAHPGIGADVIERAKIVEDRLPMVGVCLATRR